MKTIELPDAELESVVYESLQGIVQKVSSVARIPPPTLTLNPEAQIGAGLLWGQIPLINLNPIELSRAGFNASQLHGVIAHELGHIALGHVHRLSEERPAHENWQMEYSADDYAVRIGFGRELRSVLERFKEMDDRPATHTHPRLDTRIVRLPT